MARSAASPVINTSFERHGHDLGPCSLNKRHITLTNPQQICQSAYKTSIAMGNEVHKQIQEMLDHGKKILRNSLWRSPFSLTIIIYIASISLFNDNFNGRSRSYSTTIFFYYVVVFLDHGMICLSWKGLI